MKLPPKKRGIKYFLVSYTDLFGTQRAKLVPAAAIGSTCRNGAGFAGFATWLDMSPADADLLAVPDPSGLIQLPWKPEVGWLPADLVMDGKAVEQGPRNILKRLIKEAAREGLQMKSGVECEFFLITPCGSEPADTADKQTKPCYDQSALMRRYDVISEICDAMLSLGWKPYQNDHEDANGQFEMNWDYDDALVTADRHAFFKYMARSIAEKHGFRATFMPKPFMDLTGSGCHAHVSLWSGGQNVFADSSDEIGLSRKGYHFIGGLIHSADALAALTNPCVNSYKRINAPRTTSGATWAPNTVTYTGNNRTHMIRIPDGGRFEFRLADGPPTPTCSRRASWRPASTASASSATRASASTSTCIPTGTRSRASRSCRSTCSTRCAPGVEHRPQRGAGLLRAELPQAQAAGMGRLLPPPDPVGAGHDPRLLSPPAGSKRAARIQIRADAL